MQASDVTLFPDFETAKAHATLRSPDGGPLLNEAPAYFDGGLLLMTKRGTFHYASTRNNNFSNRSQKGTIVVE